jgi:orotate phosphoribosyltransferase-like protein
LFLFVLGTFWGILGVPIAFMAIRFVVKLYMIWSPGKQKGPFEPENEIIGLRPMNIDQIHIKSVVAVDYTISSEVLKEMGVVVAVLQCLKCAETGLLGGIFRKNYWYTPL